MDHRSSSSPMEPNLCRALRASLNCGINFEWLRQYSEDMHKSSRKESYTAEGQQPYRLLQIGVNNETERLTMLGGKILGDDSLDDIFRHARDLLQGGRGGDYHTKQENSDHVSGHQETTGSGADTTETEDNSCLILVRADILSNTPKWLVVVFLPPETRIPRRTILSRALRRLRDQLDGLGCSQGTHADILLCARPEEVCIDHYRQLCYDLQYPILPNLAMTKIEQLISQQKVLIPATYSCDNIEQWPGIVQLSTSDSLNEGAKRFSNRQGTGLVMTIDAANCTLLCEEFAFNGINTMVTRLEPREPRYYLISVANYAVFFLSCPEKSTKKLRVQYASCKNCAKYLLQTRGIIISKSLDVRNAVTDLSNTTLVNISGTKKISGRTHESESRSECNQETLIEDSSNAKMRRVRKASC